ncbi:eukaryotic initiation factor 4a (nucleomorph) [Guillardia theta]|uniref:RNA helicase n=1 Tax=Guillardia theta TaxID=55529 RepID=Q9SEV8_GUITH|nr:eukaryotic initiation factor 4a [Guillardia theta]AAF24007.1 eukaryotic initiation factor 4a [Guillardia theta]
MNHNIKVFKRAETFEEMELKRELLKGIYGYGFERPSFIQQRGILPIINKEDVVAQSQSGTGKTATFVIGTLQNLSNIENKIKNLVLVPTRELATQVEQVFKSIGFFMKIKTQLLTGGDRIQITNKEQYKKPQIVIGTPGKVLDSLSKKTYYIENLEYLVVDEADEMFSRGFKIQVLKIIKYLPLEAKIALFSATMPIETLEIVELFMTNPVKILVKKDELTLEGIKQFYIAIEKEEWKLDSVIEIYSKIKITQSIIYVNTRRKTEWLANIMKKYGFDVGYLHGEMLQIDRSSVMKDFRSGLFRILISTDLVSRGIDIQQVCLVINYDLPKLKEVYIHRIGRSGRFGRKGVAINFLSRSDVSILRSIEGYYNTNIEEMPNDISEFL